MNNQESSKNILSREALTALIVRARDGGQDAFFELRGIYKPLIESQVVKHTLDDMRPQDVEELRQEALVAFCNAVCNYDVASLEVEFGLYAKICIQNRLVSFIRGYLKRRKSLPISLDSVQGSQGVERTDPLQALVNKENMAELVRVISKNLSDYENRVWWMYVSGMSVSDISKALGDTNAKSVSNAIYRIRKKLKAFVIDRE